MRIIIFTRILLLPPTKTSADAVPLSFFLLAHASHTMLYHPCKIDSQGVP
jgi:hypothetical protein